MNTITSNARRRILWVVLALSLGGMGVSGELANIHYQTHTNPEYVSICAVDDAVNCETVALSPYSVFGGIPVCLWGMVGYASMGALTCLMLVRRREMYYHNSLLLAMATAFVLVSVMLGYISATRIRSLCLFCLASYIINAIVFLLAAFLVWRSRGTMASMLSTAVRDIVASRWHLLCIFGGAAGVMAAAWLGLPRYWEQPAAPSDSTENHIVGEQLHAVGATDPELTIVEYSDYECPFCKIAHQRLRAILMTQFDDSVRLVHRQFPLDEACNPLLKRAFHVRACEFALAAECAGIQGKFWPMNDALFAANGQRDPGSVDITPLAHQVGIADMDAFSNCMSDPESVGAQHLKRDIQEGMRLGITATPSFFVNGEQVKKLDRSAIEALLQRQRQ